MPKTRKFVKRSKRPMRRKVKRKKKSPFINNFFNGFPTKLRAQLKYTEHFNLNSAGAAIDNFEFRLNSMFDPNLTGVGSQPRYYDQLATADLYDVWLVNNCKYTVTFVNKATHDCLVMTKLANPNTIQPSTASTLWDFRETKFTQSRILTAVGTTHSKVTFRGTTPIWPLIANSKLSYMADRGSYQGKFDANPVVSAGLLLFASDDPNGSNGCNVDCYVTLHYDATFNSLAFSVPQS